MIALWLVAAALAGVFLGGVAVAAVSAGRRADECAECRRREAREWDGGEWRDGTA